MRFFGASPWRFPSLLHARGEITGAATQRSRPSVLHLRTGVRIPPPPPFARKDRERASGGEPRDARRVSTEALGEGGPRLRSPADFRRICRYEYCQSLRKIL